MEQATVKIDYINEYLNWIRANSTQIEINDYVEITTPYLDAHNDFLQIYIKHVGDRFFLTDDGAVLNDLTLSGCDIRSPKRRALIEQLATSLGVKIQDKEICAEATVQNIAQKQHSLYQAMLKIGDMLFTSSSRVRGLFFEEIEIYFEEKDIRYTPSVLFMGSSGLSHRFDFVISASRRYPERIITAVNSPSKQTIQAALFSWEDTKTLRKSDSRSYIILNNSRKPVGTDLVSAIRNCGITPIPWLDKEQYLNELAG